MSGMIAIKIDIDTHEGMAKGVPRLLTALSRARTKASFFLALGPDRSGLAMVQMARSPRFALKMFSTRAGSLYGWRTALSGTVLPARAIATAFPALVRRMEAEGHETAVHAWDHRNWQDNLLSFKRDRIRAHLRRAVEAYRELTGHDPAGIGAPSWTTTPESLQLQEEFPFQYASDLRGGPPCRLRTALGLLRLPQLPASGACLEELIAQGISGEEPLATGLLAELHRSKSPLRVLTVHAEVEGGPYLGTLERVLEKLRELGEVVTMQEAAKRLPPLPERWWGRRRLPGRAFPVTTSRRQRPAYDS
jgi:undecaprenyl phosphate-alpha-L-ara4FN deformylase